MRYLLAFGVAAVLFSAAGPTPAAEAVSKPQRVVSLNLCIDELVLRLAERKNIASVT